MSQLYCTGRVTSKLELKTSVKGTPLPLFPSDGIRGVR